MMWLKKECAFLQNECDSSGNEYSGQYTECHWFDGCSNGDVSLWEHLCFLLLPIFAHSPPIQQVHPAHLLFAQHHLHVPLSREEIRLASASLRFYLFSHPLNTLHANSSVRTKSVTQSRWEISGPSFSNRIAVLKHFFPLSFPFSVTGTNVHITSSILVSIVVLYTCIVSFFLIIFLSTASSWIFPWGLAILKGLIIHRPSIHLTYKFGEFPKYFIDNTLPHVFS